MTVVALVILAAVAQLTPMFATFAVDPAWASLFNFAILTYMATFTRREITTLRKESVAAAAAYMAAASELARTAKGSETRAEHAAAEITAMKLKVEEAAAAVALLCKAVKDEIRHVHGEWDRLDEARRERAGRPADADDSDPAVTPPHGIPTYEPETPR